MPIAVEHTVQAIAAVVQTVPVGTNIALMRPLWVMMSGGFLTSRGAVFGALAALGLDGGDVRRSWAAMRQGVWESDVLSVDITGFWRPRLKGWLGSHFHSLAQRTLPAVVFGLMVVAGEIDGKRGSRSSWLPTSLPVSHKQPIASIVTAGLSSKRRWRPSR